MFRWTGDTAWSSSRRRAFRNRVRHCAGDQLARSAVYDPYIEAAARATALEPALLRAVILAESGFNERAVSKKGAQGLMQLMPATALHYGALDPFDPDQNIAAGARYLRALVDRYDSDLQLVLAAYNAGESAVEKYGRRIPPYPRDAPLRSARAARLSTSLAAARLKHAGVLTLLRTT